MLAPRHLHRYAFVDYLNLEESSNVKHEFFGGEIYAMAGGSPEHAALASALTVALGAQLAGRPCRVHSSDLRIRVLATGLATYPDVTVVCGRLELDPEDSKRHTVINPTVVCEVLSPTTAEYDETEKLDSYKLIPSLAHVVLVAFAERRVTVWARSASGEWEKGSYGPGEQARLAGVGVELSVDALYRDPLNPGAFLAP